MWSRWCVRERILARVAARAARLSLSYRRCRTVVPMYPQKLPYRNTERAYLDDRRLASHARDEEMPLDDDLCNGILIRHVNTLLIADTNSQTHRPPWSRTARAATPSPTDSQREPGQGHIPNETDLIMRLDGSVSCSARRS